MKIDKRLETLCEQFADMEEPEKDYILGISETLARSIKSTMPLPVMGIERAMSEYKSSIKENLA